MRTEPKVYSAETVWGAAMAAHRINGGYIKDTEWDYDNSPATIKRSANKLMVKEWAREGRWDAVTPEDIEKGMEVRRHFNSYMFLALAGKLNDFQQQAYKIAQMTEFNERQSLELAICACLPSTYERDIAKKEFMNSLRESTQLVGNEGDKVQGEIVVLSTRYNVNFNKWLISAKMGDSYINFWYNTNIEAGTIMNIKGKIKAVRDDKTTQLNYVKKV